MVRPAFRAPSSQEGEAFLAKLGRIAPRDREAVSNPSFARCLTFESEPQTALNEWPTPRPSSWGAEAQRRPRRMVWNDGIAEHHPSRLAASCGAHLRMTPSG